MSFRLVHDTMVLVHGGLNPDDVEWARYIDAVQNAISQRAIRVLLVHSRGGGPNAKQRARIIDTYGDSGVYAAICSSSPFARGITTAIGWIYKAHLIRCFQPQQLDEAMAYLAIAPANRGGIRDTIAMLEASLGPVTPSPVDAPLQRRPISRAGS